MFTRLKIPALAVLVMCTPLLASAQDRDAHTAVVAVTADQQNVPVKAQNAEDTVERAVKRFRIGVEGGVALSPELIDVGAYATFGPIFRPNFQFRPGIDFGVGEVTTAFGINLNVLYTFPGATRQTAWSPYIGAGPNFSLSHRGFQTPTTTTTTNRFDFGDTSFNAGFNFIAGARKSNGLFLEMRATAYGVSNVRLLAGVTF